MSVRIINDNMRILADGTMQVRTNESSPWMDLVGSASSSGSVTYAPVQDADTRRPTPRRPSEMDRSLRDEADLLALFGDDALLLQTRLEQFQAEEEIREKAKKQQAIAVQASPDEPIQAKQAAKTEYEHFDKYRQWLNDELHFVHQTLIQHFTEDNVSFEEKVKFSEAEKETINSEYRRTRGNINTISEEVRRLLGRVSASIVVLFPTIDITNSKRQKHTIRNLYIAFDITCMMRFQGAFRGLRGIKSLAEYESNYGHSHLNRGAAPTSPQGFCLGSTDFHVVVNNLQTNPYSREHFEFFLIQLNEYLKWESLEGGPYCRIGEIRVQNDRSQRRFQQPSGDHLQLFYKEFLKKYPETDVQVEDTGYSLLIKVIKDRAFWDRVTEVTMQNFRLPYDDVKGATYQPPPDESHLYDEILRINRQLIGQRFDLKFKGLEVKTQLEVPTKPKEEDKKTYMAHESIRDYIAEQLEAKLNEQLQNEFCKS